MDIGESVGIAFIQEMDKKCPFKPAKVEACDMDTENIASDDRESAGSIQQNSGGTLGRNLQSGSIGKKGTVNSKCKPRQYKSEPKDTKRNDGGKVTVGDKEWKFTVAAHHLIPGEASLADSSLYKQYMLKGGKVKPKNSDITYKIKENIGYNVNGSHNGEWLPGNYAIRKGHSPQKGVSWSGIVDDPEHSKWCYRYMVACVKKAGGQFHDAHPEYNTAVSGILSKLYIALADHRAACEECKKREGDEIAPPYTLKNRLYSISTQLRARLLQGTIVWKVPYFTSQKFRKAMIKHGMLEE